VDGAGLAVPVAVAAVLAGALEALGARVEGELVDDARLAEVLDAVGGEAAVDEVVESRSNCQSSFSSCSSETSIQAVSGPRSARAAGIVAVMNSLRLPGGVAAVTASRSLIVANISTSGESTPGSRR
jgi:hypothetical protein